MLVICHSQLLFGPTLLLTPPLLVLSASGDMCCLQAGLADITQSLKNYRPSVTVLEAQMAPSRRGEGAGGTGAPGLTAANGPDGGLVAVMEQKRNAHDQAIKVSIHHYTTTIPPLCLYTQAGLCSLSDL